MKTMRILIIEDNRDIAANIGDFLSLNHHHIDYAHDGISGLKMATTLSFDLIILDINLPKLDGFKLCKKLRQQYNNDVPILMLTARDTLADKVTGFNAGAWDYLIKPFALQELDLRINALMLRQKSNQADQLQIEDLTLDTRSLQVTRAGQIIDLHQASILILELLMRSSPNIVSRVDLEYLLWGELPPESNPLRTHIHELRSKIDKPFDSSLLQTIRGKGYRLVKNQNNDRHNHE